MALRTVSARDVVSPSAPPIRELRAKRNAYGLSEHEEVAELRRRLKDEVAGLIAEGFFESGKPEAYVTFATSDYQWGLRAWLRSLRKVSSKRVIVLAPRPVPVPGDIPGVATLVVPGLHNATASSHRAEFAQTFSKLWIFAMAPLERIVFVDVDCLFLQSLDHLFDSPEILVAPDYVEDRSSSRFNSGLIALSPAADLEEKIFAEAATAPTEDGGDQGTLNSIILDRVTFVPETHNLLRHFYYFSGRKSLDDVKMIHYIVKKPWELQYRETPDPLLVELDDVWTEHLTHEDLVELVAQWRRAVFNQGGRAKIESTRRWGPHDLEGRLGLLEHRMNRIVRVFQLGRGALKLGVVLGALLLALVAVIAIVLLLRP